MGRGYGDVARKEVARLMQEPHWLRWEEQADGSPIAIAIVYNETAIRIAVERLARAIYLHYKARNNMPLTVVGVLKGCVPFLADLVRNMHCPATIEYISAASYGNATTPNGGVVLTHIPNNLAGRHVLVVDDIIGTGATLERVLGVIKTQEPKSLEACVLLDKATDAEGRTHERNIVNPRFVGLQHTGVDFVVGYGLGMGEDLRHLPYVGRIVQPGKGAWFEEGEAADGQ